MDSMDTSIDIKKYLPHRAPMLMVDMILIMDDEIVETVFEIKENNIFLADNIFTEAGLIENMAQTCSSIIAKDYFIDENNQEREGVDVVGFISAIKTLKLYSLPKVGSNLFTKATLMSKFITDDYSLCTMNCKTFSNDELLLEGEINLFIQDNLKVPQGN